jgi:hypothetical protein
MSKLLSKAFDLMAASVARSLHGEAKDIKQYYLKIARIELEKEKRVVNQ